ncbi:tetratricopeptide repeat-containing sulfotransferase family protein [Burkholderia stagnalis]|uniref:tetratricopeptide repeat-containing sulfotransferase family protein n=1 Tax=Burkholderia stagnalis TaxID=1503054 RepID=UPI000F7FB369|nr:sulfotransferase [Burkholderia stagnalis]
MSGPGDAREAARAAAIEQARAALALAPNDARAWHRLGIAWEADHAYAAAADCYRRATELAPLSDGSYNNLANCLNVLGRIDDAHAAWRTAIELAPDCATYYWNLVQSKALDVDDPCFASLERQVAVAGEWPAARQADLYFAYAEALKGVGEPARGFAYLTRANTLYRSLIHYDERMMLALLEQMADAFGADLLCAKGGAGDPSAAPVFVIGMPRSGSTLVEQVLASHPRVFGAGESEAFGESLLLAVSPAAPAGPLALDALRDAPAGALRALGEDYRRRIAHWVVGGPYERIVDKYLYNFINVGFIHLALPNARFIHTRRAPVETCLSTYARSFRDVPFSYDLGELGRFYRAYDALMAHWRAVLPPGVLLDVQYEEVVGDLEGQARRMLAHCGLDWDARCLAFHQTERQVATASAGQVRQPLYGSAVRRWRPDAAVLQPLLDGLGPALAGGAPA